MEMARIVLERHLLQVLGGIRGSTWGWWGAPAMTAPTHAVMELCVRTADGAVTLLSLNPRVGGRFGAD